MPIWSEEEVRLNDYLLESEGKLNAATRLERYDFAGGIPRVIFGNFEQYKESVEDAIGSVSIEFLAEGTFVALRRAPSFFNRGQCGPHHIEASKLLHPLTGTRI